MKKLLLCLMFTICINNASYATDRDEVALIEGPYLSDKKVELMRSSKHLALYQINSTENKKYKKLFQGKAIAINTNVFHQDLTTLTMRLCSIKDEHIKDISQFTNLRKLALPANHITDNGIKYILQLSNLKRLNLNFNEITDSGVETIGKMASLTYLDLSNNESITDKGVDFLKDLTSLRQLVIENVSVTWAKYEAMQEWNTWTIKYLPYYSEKRSIKS